jgi:hypothetical protein
MAMTKHEAVRKVADLLNLAEGTGTNPNEAAVAAAQAEAIMQRYQLERAVVDEERGGELAPDEGIDAFEDDAALFASGRIPSWKLLLASGLADVNACSLLLSKRAPKIHKGERNAVTLVNIIGRPSDVAVLRYVYAFAEREIDRLAREAVQGGRVAGRTGGNNYRVGAVRAVLDTVRDQKAKTRADFVREHGDRGRAALVKIDEGAAALDAFMREKYGKMGRHRYGGAARDDGAQRAGYRAGKRISLNAGLGRASSTTRALPPAK